MLVPILRVILNNAQSMGPEVLFPEMAYELHRVHAGQLEIARR
jgi:hypothetical protein